jgi:hypothetical protein
MGSYGLLGFLFSRTHDYSPDSIWSGLAHELTVEGFDVHNVGRDQFPSLLLFGQTHEGQLDDSRCLGDWVRDVTDEITPILEVQPTQQAESRKWWITWPWGRLELRIAQFLDARREFCSSDDEFVRTIFESATRDERAVSLALRRVIARDCAVTPEKLGASDSTAVLSQLMGCRGLLGFFSGIPYGYDPDVVWAGLIDELAIEGFEIEHLRRDMLPTLRRFVESQYGRNRTFGDWVNAMTREITEVVSLGIG